MIPAERHCSKRTSDDRCLFLLVFCSFVAHAVVDLDCVLQVAVVFTATATAITFTVPPNATIATPGIYQIFAVTSQGRPSQGVNIGLGGATPAAGPYYEPTPNLPLPSGPYNITSRGRAGCNAYLNGVPCNQGNQITMDTQGVLLRWLHGSHSQFSPVWVSACIVPALHGRKDPTQKNCDTVGQMRWPSMAHVIQCTALMQVHGTSHICLMRHTRIRIRWSTLAALDPATHCLEPSPAPAATLPS